MNAVTVRDLHLIRESDKVAIQQRVTTSLKAWWQQWLPSGADDSLVLEAAAFDQLACDWLHGKCNWRARCQSDADDAIAWSATQDGAIERLASLLLGRESTRALSDKDWAMAAAADALRALDDAILGGCDKKADCPPDLGALSGVLLVLERRLGLCWAFSPEAMSPAGVSKVPPVYKPVEPLLEGVSAQPIQVSVGLGEVDIQVSDLVALQPGDVIRFPSQLQGAVLVSIGAAGQTALAAQAQLGQQDGHLAVKLLAKHPTI
jgi:Type III flagellar switch regulator (C-ring) FliN C-term